MGSYLVFNGKENNTKSISYPMAEIISDVLPNTEEEGAREGQKIIIKFRLKGN